MVVRSLRTDTVDEEHDNGRQTYMMNKRDPLLSICDALVLLGVVWTPIYWILDPFDWFPEWKYKLFLLPVILVALRVLVKRLRGGGACHGLLETDFFKKLTLAFAAPFILFLGLEFVLAKVNFSAPLKPIAIKTDTAFLKDTSIPFVEDEALIWAFNPGAEFNGRKINQMGFADREVVPTKAPGSMRVICMGDSCSGQGVPPYSGYLNTQLQEASPTAQAWESFNMAVHGYSSAQGLRLFQTRTLALKPDYVSLYYGWNDHWQSPRPDAMRMATEVKQGLRWYVVKKLQNKLFYQLFVSLVNPSVSNETRDTQDDVLRVAPDDYRRNLEQLVAGIREIGARPILMTAPRNQKLTAALVHNKQAPSLDAAHTLHDQYNAICRDVAREQEALLLDIAKDFERDDLRQWFTRDGIHFQDEGRIYIANALYTLIRDDAQVR